MKTVNAAIFASGAGSNAEVLIKYFSDNQKIRISCVITDNSHAHVLERASKLNVRAYTIKKVDIKPQGRLDTILKNEGINFIILAGYMKLIPEWLVTEFHEMMVNIHPALLPKFGGKGMYGMNVHEAVIAAGESVSGITIHLVDNDYDTGRIIFQTSCPVLSTDTPTSLATKIHNLEHLHYPVEIEKYITKLECQ